MPCYRLNQGGGNQTVSKLGQCIIFHNQSTVTGVDLDLFSVFSVNPFKTHVGLDSLDFINLR